MTESLRSSPHEKSRPGDSRGACSVLVVDDDRSILDTVSQALDLSGFRVATAADGAEALDAVADFQPDVVLLDMWMPVMDGWEFVRRLDRGGEAPKIVLMSATTDLGRWAAEIQADGFLAKPFGIDHLLVLVENACQQAKAERGTSGREGKARFR
ncbi:MAG TPA: response regulator [Chloroflexota bacterium]|nr:response regulator [Chloroflexota bacterium]